MGFLDDVRARRNRYADEVRRQEEAKAAERQAAEQRESEVAPKLRLATVAARKLAREAAAELGHGGVARIVVTTGRDFQDERGPVRILGYGWHFGNLFLTEDGRLLNTLRVTRYLDLRLTEKGVNYRPSPGHWSKTHAWHWAGERPLNYVPDQIVATTPQVWSGDSIVASDCAQASHSEYGGGSSHLTADDEGNPVWCSTSPTYSTRGDPGNPETTKCLLYEAMVESIARKLEHNAT